MAIKRFHGWLGAAVALAVLGGFPEGCAPTRPLTVPTTPPSERNENPGLDAPLETAPSASESLPPCDSAEDCFQSSIRRLEEGNPSGAEREWRTLRESFPNSVWAERAGFLLGKRAAELGLPEADALLDRAGRELSDIREYAVLYKGEGQVRGGRPAEAVKTFDALIKQFPDSVLLPTASYQAARAFVQMEDCAEASRRFETYSGNFSDDPNVPQALLDLSDCASQLGNTDRAARALQRIWFYHSVSPEAREARDRLNRISSEGKPVPEPSAQDRVQRGEDLFRSARYEESATEYRALLARSDAESSNRYRLRLAEIIISLKRYDEAKPLLREVAEHPDSGDQWASAVFWLGRLAVRQGEVERVVQTEKQLAARFPSGPERARLLYWLGTMYEDRDLFPEAIRTFRRLTEQVPGDAAAEDAWWKIGWIHYRTGKFEEAAAVFREYLVLQPSSGSAGQFRYWNGRSAERLGQWDGAAKAYREVCRRALRSFYCHQAGVRLGSMKGETARGEVASASVGIENAPTGSPDESIGGRLAMGGKNLTQNGHFNTALELLTLNLKSEAARELTLVAGQNAKDRGAVLKLADLLFTSGSYHQSLRLLRIYFPDVLEQGGAGVPRRFWDQAYPTPAVATLARTRPGLKVDPFLVSAVIREESAYDPGAVSPVGALGLMQLMPYTADWVAKKAGMAPVREGSLLDPETNIQIGAWYLQHLIDQFNGNWILAVASYNAGPEAVERWARGGVSEMDEFIESIPYNETRYFTKRVIRSYTEYLRIGGNETAPRLSGSFSFP